MTKEESFDIFATCHTAGCGNINIPIPLTVPELGMMVVCGVCSSEITEVTDTPPVLPKEVPAWL